MNNDKIELSIKDIPEIIEQLKEAEKEIEFERKSKNLFIDDLYKVCEISLKQDKEIEKLGNELQVQIEDNTRLNEYIEEQDKKLQQKENIIKEVREYIEEHSSEPKTCVFGLPPYKVFNGDVEELLEILDKGE